MAYIHPTEVRFMKLVFRLIICAITAVCAIFVCGCQNTVISSSWRDVSFNKEAIRKVFIVSHLKDELLRRKSEDAFAKLLHRKGIDSIQSYKFFENDSETGKDEVNYRISREGCSHVLVAKLLDEKNVSIDNRPACFNVSDWNANGWYRYYYDACTIPNIVQLDILRIETALFNASNEKLVWSSQTHTELTSSPTDKDIDDWVKLVITSLLGK